MVNIVVVRAGNRKAAGGSTPCPGAGGGPANTAATAAGIAKPGFIAAIGGAGANPTTVLQSGLNGFTPGLLNA